MNVSANPQALDVGHYAALWGGDYSVGQIQLCLVQLCLSSFYRRMLIDRQIWTIVEVCQRLSNRALLREHSLAGVEDRGSRLIEFRLGDHAPRQQLRLFVVQTLLIGQDILICCQARELLPINCSQRHNSMLQNCQFRLRDRNAGWYG